MPNYIMRLPLEKKIDLTILVPPIDIERIQKELQDMSHGAATCTILDSIEVVLPLEQYLTDTHIVISFRYELSHLRLEQVHDVFL